MRPMKFAAAAIAQAAMFAASPASAAQVIYDYTGNNFTSVFSSGYTTSDKIIGTLTLSAALPASLSILTDETALVTSYSFSDGVNTFTTGCCDTGNQTIFEFMTDASGNITNWLVTLETDDNHAGDLTTEGGVSAFDQSLVDGALGGRNDGSPGVWSLQSATPAVPEPATWALFLLGFGAIGWRLRGARHAIFRGGPGITLS
jgi:hypothetical protein